MLAAILLNSCKQDEGYVVNGTVKGVENGIVYMSKRIPKPKQWYCDSAKVVNGEFVFKGVLNDDPQMVSLVCNDYDSPKDDFFCVMSFFLENSKIKVVYDKEKESLQVEGSKSHDICEGIEKEHQALFKGYKSAGTKAYKARKSKDSTALELARKDEEKALDGIRKLVKKNLITKENRNVAAYYFYEYFGQRSWQERDEILKELSEDFLSNIYVKEINEDVIREKRVVIGSKAPNFSLKDTSNTTYTLDQYKGKYLLVEFSSSWCGWCKKEIPYLEEVYKLGKNKPFEMITINLDKKRELWVEDTRKENLPWNVLSDLKAFDGIAKEFNVHGIPQIYLLSPEGKIIEKGLRGDNMIAKIKEYLAVK